MGTALVEVSAVSKRFAGVAALTRVDLTVQAGSITALLGPNGAGKTTLVRIIATLVRPDSGRVSVAGHDVLADPYAVRASIGLTGQYAGLDETLSGRDNLVLIGRLGGLARRTASQRADELLGRFGLAGQARRSVRTYSGGMRRRVDLAASLMGRPRFLVLDEPTTGLDPAARLQLWDVLRVLRAEGTTMLLTTQYLEEADRLADLIYVLDRGLMTACGTPGQLKARTGSLLVVARFDPAPLADQAGRALRPVWPGPPGDLHVDPVRGLVTVVARNSVETLVQVARLLQRENVTVAELGLRQATLDEAFLALTDASVPQEQPS
jgi:ABC-type multidrug transport system ATPase subunit